MKRLPFLTSAQRRALLVVEWVLLIGIVGFSVWKSEPRTTSGPSPGLSLVGKGEDTNRERLSTPLPTRERPGEGLPLEEPVETFPFDPNTADSTTLLRLGLSPWQVRNIYRYRAKHGRYHTPEDFMRLRGLTNEQWERLRPCIRIDKKFQYVTPSDAPKTLSNSPKTLSDSPKTLSDSPLKGENTGGDSAQKERPVKLSPGQTVDIGSADTAQLKLIPGIASKRAARIVAYRQSLGGFVTKEQAMEATEMPDSVLRYMSLAPQPVRKLNVNRLSVQQMMKHPYLSFYQAKAIFEYRRNKGDLQGIADLEHLDAFRPSDIDRLRPYIEF
ncbi:MAG: helix-hairpin-helix domain-containing protein [Bacteroidaceae bacterium]|nr:helix-hairpin-helix domain-containing protein [Bacteroidaceae bacterium]